MVRIIIGREHVVSRIIDRECQFRVLVEDEESEYRNHLIIEKEWIRKQVKCVEALKQISTKKTQTTTHTANEPLRLALRIRPCSYREPLAVSISEGRMVLKTAFQRDSRVFNVGNDIYGPEVDQNSFYHLGHFKQIPTLACGGINCCVLCHGGSSSGKTYTVFGGAQKCATNSIPFIVQQALQLCHIFPDVIAGLILSYLNNEGYYESQYGLALRVIKELLSLPSFPILTMTLWEVYDERFTELLGPEEFSSSKDSFPKVLSWLQQALLKRSMCSHAGLTIKVVVRSQVVLCSRIDFIDMGSCTSIPNLPPLNSRRKSIVHTTSGEGNRQSILAMEQVLHSISEGVPQHKIPYKESTLTMQLKDVLCSKSVTFVAATINPDALHSLETLNTLQCVQGLSKIVTIVRPNTWDYASKAIDLFHKSIREINEIRRMEDVVKLLRQSQLSYKTILEHSNQLPYKRQSEIKIKIDEINKQIKNESALLRNHKKLLDTSKLSIKNMINSEVTKDIAEILGDVLQSLVPPQIGNENTS